MARQPDIETDDLYYGRLAEGALFLAEQAANRRESLRHRAMAARYAMQAAGHPWPPFRRAA